MVPSRIKSLLPLLAGFLAAALLVTPAWGRLKDPGLSEGDIRKVWAAFDTAGDRVNVRGGYPYQSCFQKAARKHSVPLPLLVAVARGESNFDRHAVSTKDCLGIMQIRWPGTAKDLGIHRRADLFDACVNIDAGTRYLATLLDRFNGDTYLAVAAYNYGPNAVSERHVPRGAQWYAAYIHNHLKKLTSMSYRHADRILVLEYSDFQTAMVFKQIFEETVGNVPFEIYKSEKYTYDLYIVFENADKRKSYLHRFRAKTGITPIGQRQ